MVFIFIVNHLLQYFLLNVTHLGFIFHAKVKQDFSIPEILYKFGLITGGKS